MYSTKIYICISKSKDENLDKKQTRKQPKIVRNYLTMCRIEKDIKIMWKKNYLFLMINFIDKSLSFFNDRRNQ